MTDRLLTVAELHALEINDGEDPHQMLAAVVWPDATGAKKRAHG